MKLFFTALLITLNLIPIAKADKIAVIGGGAAGLVSTWLLEQDHHVTLFEAQSRLGGHAHSIKVNVDGQEAIIEAGAEFFNKTSYPHFLKLLNHFNIPLNTFTLVTHFYHLNSSDGIILPPYHDGTIEWKSLKPSNMNRLLKLKKVVDNGHHVIEKGNVMPTLQQFVEDIDLNRSFANTFLYPFLASAWGISPETIPTFSAYNSLKYLVEGNDTGDYRWYEAKNGLSEYIEAVSHDLQRAHVYLNSPIQSISRQNEQYLIETPDGQSHVFDQIIFATNANIAGKLLQHLPDQADLAEVLSRVEYFDTTVAIHGDKRFMPKDKKEWRTVNIRYDGEKSATTMYKSWKSKSPIFKSWLTYDVRSKEDTGSPEPSPLYAKLYYKHPAMNSTYFIVQKIIEREQGKRNLWFAGMWTYDNDSHESAIVSAIRLAKQLAPDSQRLKIIE